MTTLFASMPSSIPSAIPSPAASPVQSPTLPVITADDLKSPASFLADDVAQADHVAHASVPKNLNDSIVAVFANHQAAESAVKKLAEDGFAMKHLTVIGKGYHTEEKVVGFYNIGDRVKFWGGRGAFWGGLWGLFFGGVFLTTPLIGPVIVLGYTASIIIAAFESAILVGGLSALGAALYSIGIPKDSVIQYEADIKAERFLVMVHGAASEVARAKIIMSKIDPTKLDMHISAKIA